MSSFIQHRMKSSIVRLATAVGLLTGGPALFAQQSLQQVLKDTEVGAHWIYDDYSKAVSQAKETGKPLLVAFR